MDPLEDIVLTDTNKTQAYMNAVQFLGPQRDELYIVVPVTIIYGIIFVTGLLGNIFTCVVIVRNKNMHTATNYYLFSLAVSDLLLLVTGIPPEIYSIWWRWPYVFGTNFCWLRGLASETSSNASVLTITLFTVERYIAICHPFMSHRMSNLTRAMRHVCIMWVVSFLLALPTALQLGIRYYEGIAVCLQTQVILEHSFEISTFLFFLAPIVLISVLYSLIGLRLKKADANGLQEQCMSECSRNFSSSMRRSPHASTKRVVNMLVAVVIAFFICWAPFHAQRLVAIYGTEENNQAKSTLLLKVYSFLTYISGVFYYMSTCINPIFYHSMSNKFRDAFKATTRQLFCCRRSQGDLKRYNYKAMVLGRMPSSSATPNSGSIKIQVNSIKNKRKQLEEVDENIAKTCGEANGDGEQLLLRLVDDEVTLPCSKRRRSATMSELQTKLLHTSTKFINECSPKRLFSSTIDISLVNENNNKTL